MRRLRLVAGALAVIAETALAAAQQAPPTDTGYLLPPPPIVDILDAPPPPLTELSPTRDTLAIIQRASMPPISELAQPMLRLAGRRINPKTNGPHDVRFARARSH